MKSRSRLIALLRGVLNLTTGEAEACVCGREPEAVFRIGGWRQAIRRALVHRHRFRQSMRAMTA